jgi:hypothetical protein
MLENVSTALRKISLIGFICAMLFLVMACKPDPGACNCAKNSMKILSSDFDRELFDKCDSYMKKLSPGEAVEYSREMLKCGSK